ncbi:type II toxin-antitoxin system RelE/ParE family toxin [Sphingomonas sp.]|uniref:type II toxin-antitoxin system RelE/ParE family toxin n=1 Tax=Sphingomonas sp. TaxID=28214 RepID=UPI0031D9FE4E
MQRKLVWAADARRDLFDFVAEHNLVAALRLQARIREGAERALALPLAYRPGRLADTREMIVHPNYILVYRVLDDRVRILRLLHARQPYP